jgi:peptidoglycan/xylan/chitin deacetylase (PgdA/CDA1 family)
MSTKPLKSLLIAAALCTVSFAADKMDPSFDPPGGLAVEKVPLFVVLGFDDNRYLDGFEWTLNMLADKKNPEGAGNPATYDDQPVKVSFYYISDVLGDGDDAILDAWKKAVECGYEVGDHTMDHGTDTSTTLEVWKSQMSGCRAALSEKLGVPGSQIVGFRTPYLAFNDRTFTAAAAEGMLYECTMTQMQDYNKSLFVWPYTLDNGFADKVIESWVGKCKIPGLWEIPVYTVGADPTLWPPITGFDSSILTQGNGGQFETMLKNALDYRLKTGGNRAPMTVGLHTDTYAEANPDGPINYDSHLDLAGRRAALENFIDYALTKPMVRFVTAKQLIDWMRNPVALDDIQTAVTPRPAMARTASLFSVSNGRIVLNQALPAGARLAVFSTAGRCLHRATLGHLAAGDSFALPRVAGACIVRISSAGMTQSLRVVSGSGLNAGRM